MGLVEQLAKVEIGVFSGFNEACAAKRGYYARQAMVHGFGLVIGPLIGGSALDEYGPATAFYVVALAAVGTGIGYAFLPETLSESSGLRMKISLVQRMTTMETRTTLQATCLRF